MKLREYLEEIGMSVAEFARRVGTPTRTLYRVFDGKDIFISTALKIERVSKGKVKCKDMAPSDIQRKRKEKPKKKKKNGDKNTK